MNDLPIAGPVDVISSSVVAELSPTRALTFSNVNPPLNVYIPAGTMMTFDALGASAANSATAAGSVHSPLPATVSHAPSPRLASGASIVLFTMNVPAHVGSADRATTPATS